MPGFTHLQVAQPVTLGHHLLAYYEMLRRDVSRFSDAREPDERKPAGRGGAGRHGLSARPRRDGQGARLRSADGEQPRQRVRPRLRARLSVRRRPVQPAPVAAGRGTDHLGEPAVRLRETVGRLLDRLVDHAAEAQPRRGRAGARAQRADHGLPDVADGDDEGPAARLFEGHAGRQGAGLRGCRPADASRSRRSAG